MDRFGKAEKLGRRECEEGGVVRLGDGIPDILGPRALHLPLSEVRMFLSVMESEVH